MSRTKGLAAAAAIGALALAPAANAATGSGDQLVTGTVLSSISVVGAPVTLSGFTPGSATPASGSGNVTVVSTDPYCLTVADTVNAGKMANGATLTANALQWKTADTGALAAANAFRALSATATGVAGTAGSGAPITLAKIWAIDYQINLAGDNLPAGAYTTNATFTGTTC